MDRRRRLGFSYFNSRPSARGDHALTEHEGLFFISIHAPPRGATHWLNAAFNPLIFQFTPLREGRLRKAGGLECVYNISIHAPPRGATGTVDRRGQIYNFNSRPSARGDPAQAPAQTQATDFNSRPSARGDAKDMQFLQIFCSTLTNQHGLTIVPRNLSRLFW